METKHTQGELLVDGHSLYILKPDGKNRKNIAQVGVQAWGLTVQNTVIIDHEGLATAAEIAMRWNTHDSLVSALKNIIPILEAERTHTGISLDIRYQTEYWAAKQLLNSLNIKP